jgi:BED zinc finger
MEGEEQNREYDEEHSSTTKRSWVWSHFTFDESTKKAQCNYCKVFITINKGSTSGMISHVKSKHEITKDSERQGERQDERQSETQKSIEIAVSI